MKIHALRDIVLASAMALALAAQASAQDAAPEAAASEEDMFSAEETVVQAEPSPEDPANQGGFLKYDQVKIGGSVSGSLGFGAAWASAWDGSSELLSPDKRAVSPELEGKVTIVAKPAEDFGVNMDFRTSWPFTAVSADSDTDTYSVPNISVWALYSKFNWNDRVYFSFGKQPLSWGVSKGAFQPADDIFALSASIDLEDTGAEREGPISLKATLPMSATNNLYFYAGMPTNANGSDEVDPEDVRLAVKGEYGFGDTELALGAFYAYGDHPRALVMATTGIGSWNLYGEGVLKYGSERYFIDTKGSSNPLLWTASQDADRFYFSGTLGGYYTNDDSNLTVACAYLYNGEAQKNVNFMEAYYYYIGASGEIDRIKFGEHYAFASITKSEIVKDRAGDSKLSASVIAIASLSDFSGYLKPSLTWSFFDYMNLELGAAFNFGDTGDEYIVYGVGADPGNGTWPGAALSLKLSLGSGAF